MEEWNTGNTVRCILQPGNGNLSAYCLRTALPGDIPKLLVLCAEHASYEGVEYNDNGQEERLSKALFSDPPIMECLVIADEKTLIGYATYMVQFSTWNALPYLYLDCLYLNVKARNQGLGSEVMSMIYEIAQARECINIQWQTPDFNKGAIRFYQRLGATPFAKVRFIWQMEDSNSAAGIA